MTIKRYGEKSDECNNVWIGRLDDGEFVKIDDLRPLIEKLRTVHFVDNEATTEQAKEHDAALAELRELVVGKK